jgi:hypothetical protein
MKMKNRVLIHAPYGGMILKGDKTIETASHSLPERYKGEWVAIYEPLTGALIGEVKFSDSKKYTDALMFNEDVHLHLINKGDDFHIDHYKNGRYGWVVSGVRQYDAPIPTTPNKGQFRFEKV